jgi:hypothetical protein
MVTFSSLNPYESLAFIVGDSPESLILELKKIQTPIKIVAIVPYGNRHVAYIMGDVRINQASPTTKKQTKKGV